MGWSLRGVSWMPGSRSTMQSILLREWEGKIWSGKQHLFHWPTCLFQDCQMIWSFGEEGEGVLPLLGEVVRWSTRAHGTLCSGTKVGMGVIVGRRRNLWVVWSVGGIGCAGLAQSVAMVGGLLEFADSVLCIRYQG